MIITLNILKKKIIEDSINFKKTVDTFYLGEMEGLIKKRIKSYNERIKDGLPTEIKIHLEEYMKDFIYSDLSEENFVIKIEELI